MIWCLPNSHSNPSDYLRTMRQLSKCSQSGYPNLRDRNFEAAPRFCARSNFGAIPDARDIRRLAVPCLMIFLVGSLVDRVVVTLITNLQHSVIILRRINHLLALVGRLGHHLFTKNMLTGIQGSNRYWGVRPQRSCEMHGFEILFLNHLCQSSYSLGLGNFLYHRPTWVTRRLG